MNGSIMIAAVITALISYLIGSVNFSVILSKKLDGEDIRNTGSGNAGATNMLRRYGKKMAVITLLLDVAKGIAAILIARLISNAVTGGDENAAYAVTQASLPFIAGLFVVIGHDFPLFFGFKGGKGVATSLGVILMLDWKLGLVVGVCAIAVMAITRYVSLGSVLGGAAFVTGETVGMIVSKDILPIKLICCIALGALLIARHHENIGRLLSGRESKLGEKKKEAAQV